jgi:hypothetical protein
MIVHSDTVFDGDTKGRAELFAATSTMAAPRQRITWWAESPRYQRYPSGSDDKEWLRWQTQT